MAVTDEKLHPRTENLILKQPRRHYNIPVRSQHWQLRSLLSVEKSNLVYFPGGHSSNHIQRLNTTTHECETIKLLTFAPRCLVAKNGWLCCGSETGEFVAIELDEGRNSTNPSGSTGQDTVTRFTAATDIPPESSVLSFLLQAHRSNKSLVAKSMKLAKDRVNCITLWFPPTTHASPLSYQEPIAVLANNDRTVTLVSLQNFHKSNEPDSLDVINYPDFVNRAMISPDGQLLIAILDDPYLYVHERVEKVLSSESETSTSIEYEWVQKRRLLLKSQSKDDRTDSRGSFAACFSASGAYLAVGTQHGTISIFDAAALTEPTIDPLLTTFKSTRPNVGPGAIRDMVFSPAPYDILAWTEDRGHIGFADMRNNYIVRQVVDINAEGDFEHINILDRNTIDPRLLENRTENRAENRPNRYMWRDGSPPRGGTGTDTRRRGGDDGNNTDLLNAPFAANETLVLEAIQGDRRRRDRAFQRGGMEDAAPDAGDPRRLYNSNLRTASTEGDTARTRMRSSSVGRAMEELLGGYRDQRERAQDRVRNARQLLHDAAERGQGPRRQTQWMERIGDTVALLREQQRDRQDGGSLNVVEILQARDRLNNDGEHEDTSLLVPLVNQVVNRWEESAIRGALATDHGVFEVPPSQDNTAGLAWSEDGRTIFVGAQNGIYEFHMNAYIRKLYPSLNLR
jgi:WD40 repeat protein